MIREKSAELIDREVGCFCHAFKCHGLAEIFVDIVHRQIDGCMGARASVLALPLHHGAIDINENFGHDAALDHVVTIAEFLLQRFKLINQLCRLGVAKVDLMVEAVLMGIEALGEVGLSCRAIVQKFGADLKDVALEFSAGVIGDLMRFVLINNKDIVIMDVIKLTADQEAFSAGNAEKDLTAVVDMYIGIWIAFFGIVDAESCSLAGVGNCR